MLNTWRDAIFCQYVASERVCTCDYADWIAGLQYRLFYTVEDRHVFVSESHFCGERCERAVEAGFTPRAAHYANRVDEAEVVISANDGHHDLLWLSWFLQQQNVREAVTADEQG